MMSRFAAAWLLLASVAIHAQKPAPVSLEVRTEAAKCDAIARGMACLRYTQPPFPETIGIRTPETAYVKITGPEVASVIQAVVVSPAGRQWLRVKRAFAPVGGVAITDQLPQDVEIYVDEAEALQMRAGRYVATLVVTVSGATAPVKMPVQLTVGPDLDSISLQPDFIPDLTVGATQNPQPLRVGVSVRRTGVGPPYQVSATPVTSDGGNWLGADMQAGFSPCAFGVVPCDLDAIVTPPSAAGDYWGALILSSGDGFADRVAVRIRVTAAPGQNPALIEPRQISLSSPLGSTAPVSALVELKGGYDGLAFRAVSSDPWLTIEPTGARWPAVLKMTANPTGLDAGLYTESVQLRTTDTSELLATIPVFFTITAPVNLPVILDGGGWRTTLMLVNPGIKPVSADVRFWGAGLTLRIEKESIPPLGMRVFETQGAPSNRQTGWAEVVADGPIFAQAVLSESRAVSGAPVAVDATLPLANSFRDRLLLPFDNTGSGVASISLANPEDDAVAVDVAVLNEGGAEIAKEGRITLAARGAATFELSSKWPSSAGRRGLLALDFDGRRLHVAGFRAWGGSFHAYPAVARGEAGVERGIPRVAVGGAWQQASVYLTNASAVAQNGALRVWPDNSRGADTGLSAESALPVPANGALVWQASPRMADRAESGWLESRYPKQVGGFLLLRQIAVPGTLAQARYESAIAGQIGANGRIAIPFDYRGSSSTQMVVVNTSEEPTEILTTIYDLAGRFPRIGETLKLPGKGQLVVNGAEQWDLGGQQGVAVFSSRHSFRLAGVGLRSGDGPMAVLPAFEK